MASLNPICPRFLDSWSFSIFYDYKRISYAIEVIMHESCHFLYFEKWKKLYPKMNSKNFEHPHIEWHLSEIIAPIILNDPRIQRLLGKKADFYEEYQNIKIGKQNVPAFFEKLYQENKDDFEKLLKQSYKAIKTNKNLFDF